MKVSLISFATTITIIVAAPSSCAAFLNILNQANPSLTKYADAQENALLKIHLDIGQEAVQGHYDQPAGEIQEGHLHHADQA